MATFLVLACPGCVWVDSTALTVAAALGTFSAGFLFLRPYTQGITLWGRPRIDAVRVASLLLLLVFSLTPLWFISYGEKPVWLILSSMMGVGIGVTYLWGRSYWLLDAHRVQGSLQEVLFPTILGPLIVLFGLVVGSWFLSAVVNAFYWPEYIVGDTLVSLVLAGPLWLAITSSLKWIFTARNGGEFANRSHSGVS